MNYHFALAGNPNCGKTTLFNELTGSNQYVGNWPGVTVEKKEGHLKHDDMDISVVDLPGIYSLSPYSQEEIVTRNYIIDEKPDMIINIVDATNIERNLYLSLQLAELGLPMVIALNMIDVVEKRGDSIDCKLLSNLLGIPVVPISASKSKGIHKLIHTAVHTFIHTVDETHRDIHLDYSLINAIYTGAVKTAIDDIEALIKPNCEQHAMPLRWSAVKLVEDDVPTIEQLELSDAQAAELEFIISRLEETNRERDIVIADQKYKFICAVCAQAIKRSRKSGALSVSDRIDRVVTNKYLAIPLFLLMMLAIFVITFGYIGNFFKELVDTGINENFADWVRGMLIANNAADWAVGLLCDGVIAGLGAVLSFFPQIFLLFFFLSILEDSGYMARAAFIMDSALHKIGLSGRSFVPMLMGFGCSVPAVMAARTLDKEKDRRITIMMTPFMSCSAKMPVYLLFISAFFPKHQGLVIFGLYLLGIILAVLYALFLQKTVLKGGHSAFVMELPPYRMPTPKTLGLHLWERVKDFFTKAGTVLLGASVIVWFCQYFSFSLQHVTNSADSILGVIGSAIAPIFTPLGFGDWKSSVSLLSGLIARESIVSTLGILHGTGGEATTALVPVLQSVYSGASALSFMTFSLLFIPCIAAVSAIRQEMRSLKWTVGTLAMQACIAYGASFIVFQIARLFF